MSSDHVYNEIHVSLIHKDGNKIPWTEITLFTTDCFGPGKMSTNYI